ncbi:MAG: cache domain-containing protein [Microthrixaceae bacterium]
MPERVVQLASRVAAISNTNLTQIERMTSATKVLAINALIEASRAGAEGRGFTVVAEEVGSVASSIRALSKDFSDTLAPCVEELDALGRDLVMKVRGQRLADLALNSIDIIDRNLYERSCDVRWWATDSAVVDVCTDPTARCAAELATARLGVILDSYTVYLDLWVADRDGRIVAHGRPDRYAGVLGTDVSHTDWFRAAIGTRSGADFAVDDVARIDLLDRSAAAVYSTAVRSRGDVHGQPIGALGIFFDWEPQAQGIVENIRLSDDERGRTRCMLVDSTGRVLASNDGVGILTEHFDLDTGGRESGYYTRDRGEVVGFSVTPGYETYRGLGWYGVMVQRPVPVSSTRR